MQCEGSRHGLICIIPALVAIGLLSAPKSFLPRVASQGESNVQIIEPGTATKGTISGGQVHEYRVNASTGSFLRFAVDTLIENLVLTLFDPNGTQVHEVIVPAVMEPVSVSLVTEATGGYRLKVRLESDGLSSDVPYTIRLAELCVATEQHRNRVRAERMMAEAIPHISMETEQETREAIRTLDEALALYRGAGDSQGESLALEFLANAHFILGELGRSLDTLSQKLDLVRLLDDRLREADTHERMGVYARMLGDFQTMLDHAQQAMELYRAVGDKGGEINGLLGLGNAYKVLNEPLMSAQAFDQAAAVNPLGNAGTFLSLSAEEYYAAGQSREAIDRYESAARFWSDKGERGAEAGMLIRAAGIYTELNRYQEARNYLNRCLSFWQSQKPGAAALCSLGLIYGRLGNQQEAVAHLDRAFAAVPRALFGSEKQLRDVCTAYSQVGAKEKAITCYEEALTLARKMHSPFRESAVLALRAVDEQDLGRLEDARTDIEEALSVFESLRSTLAGPEIRSQYFSTVQKHYEFYVDLLMRMNAGRPGNDLAAVALQAAEKARGRVLLELLAEAGVDIHKGIDPALLERERSLRQELNDRANRQRRLLSSNRETRQAENVAADIKRIVAEYERVQGRIRAVSPSYSALAMPHPLSLGEIQKYVLDPETLLLEYSLGEKRSYLFAVTQNSMASFVLPARADVEAAARRVYDMLTERNRKPTVHVPLQRAKDTYSEAATQLSRIVLAPAAGLLGTKRLLVVTQGALEYIPFGALPDPKLLQSVGDPPPLITSHEVVYLPSASSLAVSRRILEGRRAASKIAAVMADPVFDKDDVRVNREVARDVRLGHARIAPNQEHAGGASKQSGVLQRSLRDTQSDSLPRLPFSRREAEAIHQMSPDGQALLALDFSASRDTAVSPDLSQYRIVHFATHALLDSENPELSGIVLSLVDKRGKPTDGFLRLHDIYNLDLPADLVVLSGCRTALGKEVKGEGLVSLIRGFMYAGAARVVASLWNVDDAATAEVMSLFYRNMLIRHLSPAAALRAAQLEISSQRRWRDPYYWASFQLQGEWK